MPFDEFGCLFAFFSSIVAFIVIPDCVLFYNSGFAFGDRVISHVYNDVCESTNGVICIVNRFHAKLRAGFVGASSCYSSGSEKLCHT